MEFIHHLCMSPTKDTTTGEFTLCHANENEISCSKDSRITFDKFSKKYVWEKRFCMAYIQYAKPGDNGTWTMIEQAGAHSEYGDYDFSYWVRMH